MNNGNSNNKGCMTYILIGIVAMFALGIALFTSVILFPIFIVLWIMWRKENTLRLKIARIGTVLTGILAVITIFSYATYDEPQETADEKIKTEQVEKAPAKEEKEESAWTEVKDDQGIKVYTLNPEGGISTKYNIIGLGTQVVETLKVDHDKLQNGAIFTLVENFTDDKGNNHDEYVATMYFSPETIQTINYDNWPNKQYNDGIATLRTSDSTFITPKVLDKGEDGDTEFFEFINKNLESAPEIFSNYQGIIE